MTKPHTSPSRPIRSSTRPWSWRAGASAVHLHARDRDGIPRKVERIRATGCTAILNLGTGSAGGRAELANDRLDCLELRPEVATLDCGSMNYGDDRLLANPFSFLRRAAEHHARTRRRRRDRGVRWRDDRKRTTSRSQKPHQIPGVLAAMSGGGRRRTCEPVNDRHLLSQLPDGAPWRGLSRGS